MRDQEVNWAPGRKTVTLIKSGRRLSSRFYFPSLHYITCSSAAPSWAAALSQEKPFHKYFHEVLWQRRSTPTVHWAALPAALHAGNRKGWCPDKDFLVSPGTGVSWAVRLRQEQMRSCGCALGCTFSRRACSLWFSSWNHSRGGVYDWWLELRSKVHSSIMWWR